MEKIVLWEILVPKVFPDGSKIEISYHNKWDEMVRGISSGLTIFRTAKGQWVSPDNKLFTEEMIPVRIACTFSQIEMFADITAKHYRQEAVMYYLVSEDVFIRHYDKNGTRVE